MKVKFHLHLLLFVAMVLGFSACQRTEEVQPVKQQPAPSAKFLPLEGVSLKTHEPAGGRMEKGIRFLVFRDVSIFARTIKALSPDVQREWEAALSFESMRSYSQRTGKPMPMEDEQLATALSPEGIVQIGRWICKVDMQNERVAVITEETLRNMYDMQDVNLSNAKVMWFSTSDDVLPLLESGSTGTLNNNDRSARAEWFWCGESGADGDKDKDGNPSSDGGQFYYLADYKHCYQQAGIYFSLMSELKYMRKLSSSVWGRYEPVQTNIQLKAFFRYKPKCGSERISWNPEVTGFIYDRKLTRRPYEDVTGLNKFEFHSTYTYEDYATIPSSYVTVTLRPIKKGY